MNDCHENIIDTQCFIYNLMNFLLLFKLNNGNRPNKPLLYF